MFDFISLVDLVRMIRRASSKVSFSAVRLDFAASAGLMMTRPPLCIQTLFSATSGSSHAGNVPDASMSRNSPSLSVILIQRSSNLFVSSLRSHTTTHSSSTESPYSVRPCSRLAPVMVLVYSQSSSLKGIRTSPFSLASSRLKPCRCHM